MKTASLEPIGSMLDDEEMDLLASWLRKAPPPILASEINRVGKRRIQMVGFVGGDACERHLANLLRAVPYRYFSFVLTIDEGRTKGVAGIEFMEVAEFRTVMFLRGPVDSAFLHGERIFGE